MQIDSSTFLNYLIIFLELFSAFAIGAMIGSFLNVLIYRLPRKESILWPPSHCPNCNTRIKWYENIPILSYILLKGKCSNCEKNIALRYPIVEILSGIIALLITFLLFTKLWDTIFILPIK